MAPEIKCFIDAIGAQELPPKMKEFFNRDNYFKFKGTLIIIKINRRKQTPFVDIDKSFFGVDKRVIDILNESKFNGKILENFFLILLRNCNEGWVYSKGEIN